MKSRAKSKPQYNPLSRLIQESTNACPKDLAQIENIMREEIFHSTLDWQDREQLAYAARQAFDRLNQDRELYDLNSACRTAMFQKMRADAALCEHVTLANRTAVVNADERYQTAKKNLFARLDETAPN